MLLQHRCNFSKPIEGAQRVKSAQDTIKILMKSDFSSDLTPFLTINGAQPIIGGGGGGSYKVTPLH